MIWVSKTYWERLPFEFRRPPADARVESLALRADDFRRFRALYWTPADRPAPKVAVVAMHPRVDFTHHYMFPRLVEAGIACLGAQTRNPNNDTTTVHEELVLDLAASLKYLRRKRGVEKVILLGNCGGGALAAFFQAQANLAPAERLTTTPGGAPTRFAHAELAPADAVIYVAAHRGQGLVLGDAIDPAVVDEAEPMKSDPSLDLYDPANGFRPPPAWSEYSGEFLGRYRAAQDARVRRLDETARRLIAEAAAAPPATRRAAFEPVMVVYRTMANPSFVDRRIDPSDREYGSLLSERPDLMNFQYLGLARVTTPHAWLSTWSARSSNATMERWLPGIPQPTLFVSAGRDREILPGDVARMTAALAATDRTVLDFPQARHYFEPEPGSPTSPDVEALMDAVLAWLRERFTW